jgi:DNA repair protein RadA/Sms
MVKTKHVFVCQNCGASYPNWTGKCDNCGEWNTLVEEAPAVTGKSAVARSTGNVLKPQTMKSIPREDKTSRLSTGINDLDDVLGGGILLGGVVLLAGQPGIGNFCSW